MDPDLPNSAESPNGDVPATLGKSAQPYQPLSPVSPTPIVPSLPPKKSNWVLIAGIGLLIISLLTLVGYLVHQNNQLRTNVPTSITVVASPSPVALATPTATPDMTANWKTYTNSNFYLAFNYPQTYTVKESKGDNYIQIAMDQSGNHRINVFATKNPKVVDDPSSLLAQTDTKIDYVGIKNIGTIAWKEYNINGADYSLLYVNKDILYMIDYQKTNIDIVDQILSTFQFTK